MANREKKKLAGLQRRRARIRSKILGTARCPRLSVFRSLRHISVQLIDDARGQTVAAAADSQLTGAAAKGKPVEQAQAVGKLIGEKAKALGISQAVFDRGGRQYHGRVKAVAEGARQAGLTF